MKIPKRFKLMGKTITVEIVPDLLDNEDATGAAEYRKQRIRLQKIDGEYVQRTVEDQEHWFLHELTHHIFNALDEIDLRNNEKLVEQFSGLLHQALTTAEYDEPKGERDVEKPF